MSERLLARFPSLGDRLPWVKLGVFPTPVERVEALGAWVKRDDLTAPEYGGNKVRKLEWVLADARARGRRAVLTVGGTGSNHVVATAVFARKLGFAATHAVLFPQPETPELQHKAAAARALDIRAARAWKPFIPFAMLWRGGASIAGGDSWPYVIGPGASSPLGSLGYVEAGLELAAQIERGEAPAFDDVYVPLGSGGTVAGLAVGFRLAGLRTRIVAVRTVPAPWVSVAGAGRLATRTARFLAAHAGVSVDDRYTARDFEDVGDQLGPGYGAPTPAAIDAVARARDAGLRVDTTYGGKALAALLARRDPSRRVLFWLTYSATDPTP